MKAKKTRLIIAAFIGVAVLVGGGGLAVVAHDSVCFDPLTEMIRQEVARGATEKAQELSFMEKIEAKICGRQFMTREELIKECTERVIA